MRFVNPGLVPRFTLEGGNGSNQHKQLDQIDPVAPKQQEPPVPKPATTAESLAKVHGVSRETVKRAAKFAADVAKNPRLIVS